jgi:translation initiation factor 2 subunit 2
MADNSTLEAVTADMDELSFDPTMKKKKSSSRKKGVASEDPSTAEVVAEPPAGTTQNRRIPLIITEENGEDLFAGKKKKPSKKILKDVDEVDAVDTEQPEDGDDLDFSNLKKKKKKSAIEEQIATLDAQLEEAGVIDEKDIEVEGEDPFSKGEGEERKDDAEAEEEAWLKSDRDYTYEEVSILYPFYVSTANYEASASRLSHSPRKQSCSRFG